MKKFFFSNKTITVFLKKSKEKSLLIDLPSLSRLYTETSVCQDLNLRHVGTPKYMGYSIVSNTFYINVPSPKMLIVEVKILETYLAYYPFIFHITSSTLSK